jgi:hypothetical protein
MSDVRLTIDASQALNQLEGVDRALAELTRSFSESAQKINASFAGSTVGNAVAASIEKGLLAADKLKEEIKGIGPELTKNLNPQQAQAFAAATAKAEKAVVELDAAIEAVDPLDFASVKRYEKALTEANKAGKELGGIRKQIEGVNEEAGLGSKLLSGLGGAIAGIAAGVGIAEAVTQLKDLQTEVNNTRGELARLTNASGEALDAATASLSAISATFGASREELLQSVNALQGAFDGLGAEDAAAIIESGFLKGANASGEFLEVLREYPRLFDEMGFSAQEFVDIQALAGQEGVYSDKGVDAVKEFGLRIREQTVATKTALDAAFGKTFTDELFAGINDGSVTVKDALVKVSTQLATTEVPAKNLGMVLADVFGGPGEDAGVDFIKSLSNMGGAFRDASPEAQAYTQRLQEQLEAEKQLAAAKINAVDALNELTAGTETFGQQAQTFGINVLAAFLQALRPVVDAFLRFKNSIVQGLQTLGILSKTATETTGALDFLTGVFDILGRAVSLTVDAIGALSRFLASVVSYIPGVSSGFSFLREVLTGVVDIISQFPAYLSGTVAAFRQAGTNISNFFSGIVTEAQIAFAQVSKLNPFGEANEQIDKEIAKLKAKKADIQASTRSLSDAFQDGFKASKPRLTIDIVEPTKAEAEKAALKAARPVQSALSGKKVKTATEIEFENRSADLAKRRLLLNDLEEGLDKELEKVSLHFEALKLEYEKAGLDISTLDANQNKAEISAIADFLDKQTEAEYQSLLRLKETRKAIFETEQQALEGQKQQKDFEIDLAEERGKQLVLIAQKSGAKESEVKALQDSFARATQEARLQSELEFQQALLAITDEGDANQIEAIKRRIALIQAEIGTLKLDVPTAQGPKTSIWSLLGIDIDTKEGQDAAGAIEEVVARSIAALQDLTAARIEAANEAANIASENVKTKEAELETELRLAEEGFASNVSLKQQELEQSKRVQAEAIENQRKAQRTQVLLDTAIQASSLATAVANLFKQLTAALPLGAGIPIAIALSATMFAAFAKARIDALKATRARYGLTGFIGKDGIIKGKSHSQGGQTLEVERGEMFQVGDDGGRKRVEVVRRENTTKYMDLLRAANENDKPKLAALALDLSGGAGKLEIERRAAEIAKQMPAVDPTFSGIPVVNFGGIQSRVLEKSERGTIVIEGKNSDKQIKVLEAILSEMKRSEPPKQEWLSDKKVRRGSVTTEYK